MSFRAHNSVVGVNRNQTMERQKMGVEKGTPLVVVLGRSQIWADDVEHQEIGVPNGRGQVERLVLLEQPVDRHGHQLTAFMRLQQDGMST